MFFFQKNYPTHQFKLKWVKSILDHIQFIICAKLSKVLVMNNPLEKNMQNWI